MSVLPPDPGFGVIVPTFNRAAFIGETLAAILAQTLPPREVIVIDDGSTDGTASVVAGFPVRYHRIVNGGAPAARNAGIARARGPWLAFCDDDDVWRPGYLESFARVLATCPARYGFANFGLIRDGVWSGDKFAAAPPGFFAAPDQPLYLKLLEFQPIFPSGFIIRRDFAEELGGYDIRFAGNPSEDFEFALRCAQSAPVAVVHEPVLGIRKHGANVSRDSLRNLVGQIAILRWAREHHDSGRRHAAALTAEIGRRCLAAADLAFCRGDTALFRSLAREVPAGLRSPKFRVKRVIGGIPGMPGSVLRGLFGETEAGGVRS
jgi:glycosyltransferase involved in cell wall biosynthesis